MGGPRESDTLAAAKRRTSADRAGADVFGRLATELHDAEGVENTVEAVVQFALSALQCSYAGIALIGSTRRPEVVALTHPQVASFYQLQIDAGEGPVITAIQEGSVVVVTDVAGDTRWSSAWRTRLRDAGIRSVVHVPLPAAGRVAAVLSLFSQLPDAFDGDDLAVAHILAEHASVAIATARQEAALLQAIDARKLIGQAMGIVMERYDLDADRAFGVLKRYSQQSNRKLRDVAQELIDTRRLPG